MSEPIRIRVCCVDGHPLLREGVPTLINNQPDMLVVGQASTGREAIQGFENISLMLYSWISAFRRISKRLE